MSNGKEYLEVPQKDQVDAEPQKPPGLGIRHLQLLCMLVTTITLIITRSSMGVAVLAMTDKTKENDTNTEIFHWDKKTQGLVLSSFFWGYVIMQIPAGALAKRYGGKPLLEVALIINGLVCLITPLLASYGGWYLVCMSRVLIGLSQSCTFPTAHTLIGKWLPASERTVYVGYLFGGGAIGIILAMPLSGVLADTALGWKMIFYAMGALCFMVAIMWHYLAASSPREHPWVKDDERRFIEYGMHIQEDHKKVPRTPWIQIITSGGMFAIVISQVASTIGFVLFFTDLPTYLEKGLKMSLKNSASVSALPYVGSFVGSIVSSLTFQVVFNKKMFSLLTMRKIYNSIGLLGGALGLIMLLFLGPDTKEWAVVSLVGAMFCQGFFSGGYLTNYFDLSPNFAGVMLSITNFISNTFSIFTPILTSVILRNDPTDVSRWRVVFLGMAVLLVIANTIYLFVASTTTADWDDPEYFNKKNKTVETPMQEKPLKSSI